MSTCIDCGLSSPFDLFQLCCGARLCNYCGPPHATCPKCGTPPKNWDDPKVLYESYKNLAAKGDNGAAEKFELFCIQLLQEHPDNNMVRQDLKQYGPRVKKLQNDGLSVNEALKRLNCSINRIAQSETNQESREHIRRSNFLSSKCAECAKDNSAARCSQCKVTVYCSRECQVKHWKKHKKLCKDLAERREKESSCV